jgi:1,4-dihydroxy-2-naphthoate octaprenyltransferase
MNSATITTIGIPTLLLAATIGFLILFYYFNQQTNAYIVLGALSGVAVLWGFFASDGPSAIASFFSSSASGASNVAPSAASGASNAPISSTFGNRSGFIIAFLILAGVVAGVWYTGNLGAVGQYIGLFAVLALVVFGTVLFSQKSDKPGNFVPTTLFRMLYYFLPYGIVTYAALADLFNTEFKYSGGIITGAITIIINRLIAYYALSSKDSNGNVVNIVDSNYCGIPGLGKLGSNLFPQGMLFNLTTLSYLASLITFETERDTKYTIPAWTFLIAVFFTSSFLNIRNDCFDSTKGHGYWLTELVTRAGGSKTLGITATLLATLATSVAAGSLGAFGAWAAKSREGFAGHVNPKKEKDVKNKQDENIVNVSTALSEVCPAIAEDQIVAEIYQNGKKLGTSLNE